MREMEIGDVSLQDETMPFKDNSVTEEETRALHEDEPYALPSDAEPPDYTVPCPDLTKLVEEVTCLVREISLAEVCRDPQQEAVTEDSEQLGHFTPNQKEDFSDSVLEEEMSSSADDSFEVQLSKITHLSLIINDGSADILPFQQQPEE